MAGAFASLSGVEEDSREENTDKLTACLTAGPSSVIDGKHCNAGDDDDDDDDLGRLVLRP